MRVGSLFAGVGGFDLAAERAGMEVVWQSEIDRHASQVLEKHWPHVPNLGDISGIVTPARVDVLTGGFPCQDYSVAGLRGGLAGDRGALWWQFHRLIADLRPAWVVGENVPGLLSSNEGRDFGTIISSLVELGYGVCWRVLDAQYFGVAQRRRRVFIVGHSGGVPRPEILFEPESCDGDSPPSREAGEGSAPTLAARTHGGGGLGTDTELDGALIPVTARTLTQGALSAGRRQEDDHNLIAFNWQAGGSSDFLGANGHRTDALHVGQTPAIAFAQNQRDEVRDLGDTAGALAAEPGMKQQTYLAQTFDWQAGSSGDTSFRGKSRSWIMDEPGRTRSLTANRTLALASPQVRRLTPVECERLQGFPDGWTAGQSDTQRYRQMGNAVAVPVVEWILRRVAASEMAVAA